MSSILTIDRLRFKNKEARLIAIDAFHDIIEYTTPNEPEVLQYVCALPLEDSLESDMYMIEEYTNQAANDAHFATKPVQDLVQLFTTGDILAQPPEVHNCLFTVKRMSGSPLSILSNPAIVLMNAPSKPGSAVQSVEEWKDIAELSMTKTKGVNVFSVVEDKEGNSIRMQCVAQDWNAFADLQSSVLDGSAGRIETVKVRPIDGFLGREGGYKL